MAARRAVRLIPVVVHVVHKTTTEKISRDQVKSQIKVLNQDFRARNPDKSKVPAIWQGLVGDTRIEFKLATKDPTGKTTSGIIYTPTTKFSFGSDDTIKSKQTGGVKAWPTTMLGPEQATAL